MMTLLAARVDRSQRILVNTRLDHYPAHFYVEPEAVDAFLKQPYQSTQNSLALLEAHWNSLAAPLERLVRRHGSDFEVTLEMLVP